jgi:hypothetical protein
VSHQLFIEKFQLIFQIYSFTELRKKNQDEKVFGWLCKILLKNTLHQVLNFELDVLIGVFFQMHMTRIYFLFVKSALFQILGSRLF